MKASVKLDPRVNAFRPDLADVTLQPFVEAGRYTEPKLRQCVHGLVPMLAEPKAGATRVSEIRFGEFVDVLEWRDDGFAWVQNRSDRYVGYIEAAGALTEEIAALSNRIRALQTFVFAEPSAKAQVLDRLTLGSYVRVVGRAGDFWELAGGGFVFVKHVALTEAALEPDYVFTAGRLLAVPYLWGGRTPLGLDCSGLVQLALDVAGIEAPRDSDQQAEIFGHDLPAHWRDMAWRRGDLVFFKGHVGIMTSYDHIIHANAFAMQVTAEPLAQVVERGADILSMGRPALRS